MKRGFILPILLVILLLISAGVFYYWRQKSNPQVKVVNNISEVPLPTQNNKPEATQADIPEVSVIAEGLEVPWALAFLPGGGMLVTERTGRVRLVSKEGNLAPEPIATISSVKQIGEGGLHGIVLHPDFQKNKFVYLYYTYAGSENATLNRVVRYVFDGNKFSDEKIIVDAIPGSQFHDGGRIKFGPDKLLYIATGDAQQPSLAQDKNALAGKILRVTDDGSPAPGNPFANRTYSFGHRNPQGIAWDQNGTLWQTEHGPSGTETGNDEVNIIEPGKNYGWPEIRGTQSREGMVTPILESGRGNTWAPAGLAFINKSFYFAGLRGEALYEVEDAPGSPKLVTHFKNEFGRLREVVAGPDGMLYVTTSNRDGRGTPKQDDDKILRINPLKI
jgi:glucose/arabinose dehydrogenase